MTGVEASIKKLTPGDLRKFYDKYYRPNNAVLIVAGDITEAALRRKLEAAFQGWKPQARRRAQAAGAAGGLADDQASS